MGVGLAPIIVKKVVPLEGLRGRSLAVDANNLLYQFLSLVRRGDGQPLTDHAGNITSHLSGLLFRSTRLISDYDLHLLFVFDGKPHALKSRVVAERLAAREKAAREWREALSAGDYKTAFSKAVMTSRLTKPLVDDAKRLLSLLGLPCVQAPGEAEAQASYIARRGDVWASNSRDYDSLLFGSPRLVRYATISGSEFLPSKGIARPLRPEVIELEELLKALGITREQLVDLAILMGTDYSEGVKGIGPKTALRLVKKHGCLENMPHEIGEKLGADWNQTRDLFLNPAITDSYQLEPGKMDEEGLYEFLCEERGFSEPRVDRVVQRMRRHEQRERQTSLGKWF